MKRLVLERLMRYYQFLSEPAAKKLVAQKSIPTVTSAEIAKALDVDPTQVRKDFAAIGLLGMGRVGYDMCEVCRAIRVTMGFHQPYDAVLVGAGHLGGALAAYTDFERFGLNIVSAFDNDPSKVGGTIGDCPIRSLRTMKPFIKRRGIRLAILSTPAEVSQKLTDRLVSVGVKAIWNFTSARLAVPADVLVRNEHISMGLAEIAYHLKQ